MESQAIDENSGSDITQFSEPQSPRAPGISKTAVDQNSSRISDLEVDSFWGDFDSSIIDITADKDRNDEVISEAMLIETADDVEGFSESPAELKKVEMSNQGNAENVELDLNVEPMTQPLAENVDVTDDENTTVPTEPNMNDGILRRSKRVRRPPIDYWTNKETPIKIPVLTLRSHQVSYPKRTKRKNTAKEKKMRAKCERDQKGYARYLQRIYSST